MTTFRTSREIPAPAGDVFAAFANPERLARWWGPDGFTSTFDRFEFVPGGRWVFTLHGPDGKNYPNESVFTAIDTNRKVVLWHESGHQFELTVTLQERPTGTLVLWEQAFVDPAEAEAVRHVVEPANEQNLDRLTREVKSGVRD
jgi:uncharacterized protein YndB with AHSA1/START domain